MEAVERIPLQQFPWNQRGGVPRVPVFGTQVLGLPLLFLTSPIPKGALATTFANRGR